MFSYPETLRHSVTTFRTFLRRVGRIHFDHPSTSFFRFVRQDHNELTPPRVTDALRQMRILDHPFDVQIFDRDRVELSHDFERRLVMKIRPLPTKFLMLPRQQSNRLPPPVASLVHSARDSALRCLQFSFGLSQEFGILGHLAGRERGEMLDPDIDPNRSAGFGEVPGLILLDRKDHIPTIRFTLDRAGLDLAFDRTGETNPARADFRQVNFVALQSEPALRIGEGIVARGRFESRIARRFSAPATPEKGIKGLVHSAKGVLKHLAINLADIFPNLFDLRKLEGLSVIVNRQSVDLISVSPFFQRGIVKLATNVEGRAAGGFEFGIDLQLIFVGFHCPHYTLVTMAKQQLQALHHCVFSLHFHLVLVTKYRRKAITKEVLDRLEIIFRETLEKWNCELIEFNGEEDHIHLLFQANPTVQLSKLVNNLKTVSSRLIRRDFRGHVNRIYRKPVFWHRSYCLMTAGGATIEVLRKYIEEQGREE
jgi:REP-associated tyrosine transposase